MGDALDIIGVYLKHLAEHASQDALACLVPGSACRRVRQRQLLSGTRA